MSRFTILAVSFLLACLLISACGGDNSGSSTAPVINATEKADFIGVWNGDLEGSVTYESGSVFSSGVTLHDMGCRLEFSLFEYDLVLRNYNGDTETVYSQTGQWNWTDGNPGVLEFFEDSISLVVTRDFQGGSSRSMTTARPVGKYTCQLEFTEDNLTSLRLFEFDPNLRMIEMPDSVVISLTRSR